MAAPSFLLSVLASSALGIAAGFLSGLVPGLHMNNIAAALTAHAAAALVLFESLVALLGGGVAVLAISCFLASALVSHMFSEAIPSTYLGIPAADVVSVLPGHRLAKAGLGGVAVRACAEGSLAGVVLGVVILAPVCVLMGPPLGGYAYVKSVMGLLLLLFSAVLLVSEGFPSLRLRGRRVRAAKMIAAAASIFLLAGLLGEIVLDSNYNAASVPEFPWLDQRFVPRSELLLPLFAGLFGVPTLLLSMSSSEVKQVTQVCARGQPSHKAGFKDAALSLLGGAIVGWIPGMTSGSSATLLSPGMKDIPGECDVESSSRFIWLYSAISASGAVLALGALFVIMRARSGVMDAVAYFLGRSGPALGQTNEIVSAGAILLSMVVAAAVSYLLVMRLDVRLGQLSRILCSRRTAATSLAFIIVLSALLTGTRGLLLMGTASALGLLPPMLGVRRIQLMGCLLVPVAATFLLR